MHMREVLLTFAVVLYLGVDAVAAAELVAKISTHTEIVKKNTGPKTPTTVGCNITRSNSATASVVAQHVDNFSNATIPSSVTLSSSDEMHCGLLKNPDFKREVDRIRSENTFVVYTKTEVDAMVNPLVARIDNLEHCIVAALDRLAAAESGQEVDPLPKACLAQ